MKYSAASRLTLLFAFALLLFAAGCSATLEVTFHSQPGGAFIAVEGEETGKNTPSVISRPFPPEETVDDLASYSVTMRRDSAAAHGRVLCFKTPGGVNARQGSVAIAGVQSLDDSAWALMEGRIVKAWFPQEGNSFLVVRWGQGYLRNVFQIDGAEKQQAGDWMQVYALPAGSHRIEALFWDVDIEADQGFCVQADKLRTPEAEGNVAFSFEPGQLSDVLWKGADGKTSVPRSGQIFQVPEGKAAAIEVEAKDGRRCTLRFSNHRKGARMHLRITTR